MDEKRPAVYMMTNRHHTVLYTGVTSDLGERIMQHKAGVHRSSFTRRYNLVKLVYWEISTNMQAAIVREKQIKSWRREKKVALITAVNPEWDDLAEGWDWRWSLGPGSVCIDE